MQFSIFIYIVFIFLFYSAILYGKSLNDAIRKTYTPNATYVTPTPNDLEKAKKLFYHLFSSSDIKVDTKAWDSLGFEIERMDRFLVVKEKEGNQTGKGVYVFNTSKPSALVIEAPHHPSDKYTGPLAVQLMEEGYGLATALNTVHRKKANFTRESISYFNAFTEAFGEAYSQGTIIQLHGFDGELHDTATDLILSATTLSPPPLFYVYAECLRKLPIQVSLYPQEIKILGGTKNINAKKFRAISNNGLFLHLEMSVSLREKLKKNQNFRKTFFGCFVQTRSQPKKR